MWFVIFAEDNEQSLAARQQARPEHIKRLQALQDDGRLLVAGPCPAIAEQDPGALGFSGSLIIAEFDSLAAAEQWANNDPYWAAGVYQRVTVKPFNAAFPC
ncbi:YciI family protein [Idiomarina seosinensis]|uniref:YciI family protein n=1 Tax=Idiomarina seosinensis TaxID=281739 RepID=UPI00384E8A85